MSIVRHVIVRGRVQGVGYRMWVGDTAQRLGLEGWVRNRRDGTVEAVFFGSEPAVAAAVEACRSGPRGAQVEAVDAKDGSADLLAQCHSGEPFSVLRTG